MVTLFSSIIGKRRIEEANNKMVEMVAVYMFGHKDGIDIDKAYKIIESIVTQAYSVNKIWLLLPNQVLPKASIFLMDNEISNRQQESLKLSMDQYGKWDLKISNLNDEKKTYIDVYVGAVVALFIFILLNVLNKEYTIGNIACFAIISIVMVVVSQCVITIFSLLFRWFVYISRWGIVRLKRIGNGLI